MSGKKIYSDEELRERRRLSAVRHRAKLRLVPEWKEKMRVQAREWRKKNPVRAKQLGLRARLKRYGITPNEYHQLLVIQNGCCGICDQPMNEPHIDHSHTTGKVRGLLCMKCNAAIGGLKDSPKIIRRAAEWVEKR